MISFAEVAVGTGEPVSCGRCVQAEPATLLPAERILAEIRRTVSAWREGPGPNVALVGGEPFAHPELPAIISAAVDAGVVRLRLRTGAGALRAHGNADGAVDAGVRHLEVVALGQGWGHDAPAGAAGSFADTLAGVRAFRGAADARCLDVAVTGLVPVCRHNLEQAAAAVAALGRAGAVSVALDVAESAARSVGAAEWLQAAVDTGVVNRVWVYVRGAEIRGMSRLHGIAPACFIGVES